MRRFPCYRPRVVAVVLLILVGAGVLLLFARARALPRAQFDVVGLVGSEGEALETFSTVGRVAVRGETWRAAVKKGIIERGARVRVVAVEAELTLVVEHMS